MFPCINKFIIDTIDSAEFIKVSSSDAPALTNLCSTGVDSSDCGTLALDHPEGWFIGGNQVP